MIFLVFESLCASPPAKVGYGGQFCVTLCNNYWGYNTKTTKKPKGSQRKYI